MENNFLPQLLTVTVASYCSQATLVYEYESVFSLLENCVPITIPYGVPITV